MQGTRIVSSWGVAALGVFVLMALLPQSADARRQAKVSEGANGVWIGGESGPEALGGIRGALVDSDGRIYVLDHRLNRVVLFSPKGVFLSSLGRPGRGPGEFAQPVSLMWVGRDSLAVLDVAQRRITVLFRDRDKIELSHTVQLEVPAVASGCAINGRLFVLAPANGFMIHEASLSGSVLQSFGEPVKHSHPVAQSILNRATIACDSRSGMLLVGWRLEPLVAAFTSDGEELWRARLPSFTPHKVEVTDRGVALRPGSRDGSHVTSFLWVSGEGRVKVQVALQDDSFGRTGVYRNVNTITLDGKSGHLLGTSDRVPLFGHVSYGRAFAFDDEPFPHLAIFPEPSTKP